MPQAQDERVLPIEGFSGLNIREARNAVGDKDLTEAINFDLGRAGELTKRTGFLTVSDFAASCRMLGFLNSDTRQEFIVGHFDTASSTWHLMTSTDGIAFTDRGALAGTPHHGVQYVDKFYVVCTGGAVGLHQWDGALTQIAGTPQGTFCRVFKDRLFVLNTNGTGVVASRIYFSNPFDFSSTGWPATNYVGVSEGDGDRLVACVNVQDTFVIFKSGSMHVLYVQGDFTLWILRPFNSEVGCISKNTVVTYEGVLYFCASRGVFQTDGNTVRNISTDISPAFSNVVVSTTTINQSSAFIWEDKYVLSLETFPVLPLWNAWAGVTWNSLNATLWSGAGSTISFYAYHIRQKGWTRWVPVGVTPHIFVTVTLTANLRGVYGTSRQIPGKLYKFGEVRYQDDAANYLVAAETKEFDFGKATELKRGKWLGVSLRADGTHTFTHVVDGSSKPAIVAAVDATKLEHKVKGPEYFRSWRFRAEGTHSNPVTFFGLSLHVQNRRHMAGSRG